MIRKFFRDERAATVIEYALIIACVSICVVAAASPIAGILSLIYYYVEAILFWVATGAHGTPPTP